MKFLLLYTMKGFVDRKSHRYLQLFCYGDGMDKIDMEIE